MNNINQKKVSIIIPVYNASAYLERCIKSIVLQSYKNIEAIFIDDGSSDSSWEDLQNYKLKYPNLIFIYHQENMGVSKTRNKGIQLATGDYLMFIDNDDFIDQDYVMNFVNEIEMYDADIIIGGYRRPDGNGKIIEEVVLADEVYSKYKIVAAWAKIYQLDYIRNNDIKFLDSNIGEDIHFTIQAVTLTSKIKITNYIGYNWFYNEKSVSNTTHKNMDNNLQFEYLLNSTLERIKNKRDIQDDYIEYYFIKLIIWFFLYSARGAHYNTVKKNRDKYFNWLDENFINYKKNKLVNLFRPKGESFEKRAIVAIFMLLHKLHLDNIFLYVYSKL